MIPIFDSVRARTFPYVNVTIIAINFLVFFYELALNQQAVTRTLTELDVFISHWGNVPACTLAELGRHTTLAADRACRAQPNPLWTPLTAMFIHGGWLHIIGNMLFLFIFGDNVEDAMGHARYLVFYLLVGLIAAFTQMAVDPDSLTPAIGASGAIAGVLGAYLLLFPRATVAVSMVFLFFIPLPVPAWFLIGLWFVSQLFTGFASFGSHTVGAGGGVAYFAHIGGFVAGVCLVNLFVLGRPPRRSVAR